VEVFIMSRNLEQEIDSLKDEIRSLSEAVMKLADTKDETGPRPLPPPGIEEPGEIKKKLGRAYGLHEMHPEQQGMVSYYGYFEAGGRGYYWDATRGAGDLLRLDDERVAKVLAALGSKQRL
jgi:hypothetical protein